MGHISQHKIVLGQSWSHSLMHQLVWVWAVLFAWLDCIKGGLDKERAGLCIEDVTVMEHKKSCPGGTDTLGEWWPLSRIRKSVCQRLTCAGKKIGTVKAVGVIWVVSRVKSCGE